MGASQSIKHPESSLSVLTAARRLIYCLAAAAAVAATIAGPVNLRAQREVLIPQHAYMPPDFPATVNAFIPTPQYLPPGYELWKVNRHPADGFGTGKAEIEVQYRDPVCWARKTACPLQVFVSPMTDRPFAGTTGHTPQTLRLHIGKRTVEAQYFIWMESDSTPGGKALPGRWEARLEGSNSNTLVFAFDRYMIAIRGNRLAGAGRSELIKIAKSLAYTKR
jgi:hypothetical protein